MRQHASLVVQDIGMAVWRLDHVTNSGRSAGSTIRHDAKLTADSLSHAGNAETESAAPRNKPLWRPSLRRHATFVAQHVGMAVPHVSRDTRSCRQSGAVKRVSPVGVV